MSSASDKKPNFFFANCLHCQGIIRVPIAIRPNSSVNCPHCSSHFELVDFMDQIPEVEVIAGQEQNGTPSVDEEFHIETGTEKQDGKFVVPPQLAAGIKKRRRRRRRSESSRNGTPTDPSQMSEADELKQTRREERAEKDRNKIQQQRERAATVKAEPRKRRTSTRPPTPKRNPVFETLKIVLGGLLAAPIAYFLLMWVFSKDPLNLRHTIYNYAPLLVPESLIDDNSETLPGTGESKESLRGGLPIPQTDPDDVDPMKVELDIE